MSEIILTEKNFADEVLKSDIPVLVDAAQSAPHMALDVQQLNCDFLAFKERTITNSTVRNTMTGHFFFTRHVH